MKERPIENDTRFRLGDPLILFALALAVRLAVFPYWQHLPLSGDEIYYWTSAKVIADGHLTKNFLHPPLWTYMLSIPALLSDNPVYGRSFTVIISSFSVPVIYLLGKCVFNRKVGIIAGIIYSFYPNIVGFSHYLWTESLMAFLILLSTLFLFTSLKSENKRSLLYSAFFIISIGLLVKEFAVIQFGSCLITVVWIEMSNKKQIIMRAIIIFLAPAIIYSAYASVAARRPSCLLTHLFTTLMRQTPEK